MASKRVTKPRKRKMATAEDFAAVDFQAAITGEAVDRLESEAQDWGITRRTALLLLTKSKAEMVESFGHDRERIDALLEACESLNSYRDWLKGCEEAMSVAHNRMISALSTIEMMRPDLMRPSAA